MLKRLRHVNIVRYLGTERTLDSLNIFLEYVPGGSIHSLLVNFRSFGEPVVRRYTRRILAGLSFLHRNRIVHRGIIAAHSGHSFGERKRKPRRVWSSRARWCSRTP